MKTISVRLTGKEKEALTFLVRTLRMRSQSHLLRKLIREAAATAGFGVLRERCTRRA